MFSQSELKACLTELSKHDSYNIKTKLNPGDLVVKAFGVYFYQIDDVRLHERFGDISRLDEFLERLYHNLDPEQANIDELFRESKVVPFSKAVNANLGNCLEKSVIVQLAAQQRTDCFLMGGFLDEESEEGLHPNIGHSYNILYGDGIPYLVDAQKPLIKDDGTIIPYAVPIIGLSANAEFIIPKPWHLCRTYSLC
jgi:hypothetical protein